MLPHDVYSLFYNGLICFVVNCTNGIAPHRVLSYILFVSYHTLVRLL